MFKQVQSWCGAHRSQLALGAVLMVATGAALATPDPAGVDSAIAAFETGEGSTVSIGEAMIKFVAAGVVLKWIVAYLI